MSFTASSLRLSLAVCAAVAALSACPGGTGTPDAGNGPDQVCDADSRVCDNDRVCGGGFCDKDNDGDAVAAADDDFGCCVKTVCTSDADCDAGTEKCDVRRGICINKNTCDPNLPNGGECESGPCCSGTQLCEWANGVPVCVDAAPNAAACFIATGGRIIASAPNDTEGLPAVAHAGEGLQLEAIGLNGDNKPLPHTTFNWTTTSGAVSAQGVLTADCAADVCDVTVTATAQQGGASCDALVRVYAAVGGADQRIVLIDIATGEPIANADVAVTNNGTPTAGTTDADGAFVFTGAAPADAVSGFPDGYQWNTIMDPPNDVILYVGAIPEANQVAGIKGHFNFDSVHTQGDISLGLAGTAIASSITDLNFATIIGEIADYNVEIEGITDEGGQLVPLPSGLVLNLGNTPIKGDYVTFGEPGANMAWAIGGKVRLADIGPIISSVTAADDVNIGSILGAVLPFFSKFDHAVVGGLNLTNEARPAAPGEDQPVPYGDWPFDERDIVPNTLLALSAKYTMPDLPCTPGGGVSPACTAPVADVQPWATGAVLLSGVIVPGIGLVPLGLTAGLDDPDDADAQDQVDGKLDYKNNTAVGSGEALIDFAPPHDGLEGKLYVSVAIALDIDSIANSDGGFGASIVTHVTDKYSATNTFPAGKFLESQRGTFVPGAAGSFTMQSVGTADFFRVNMDDGDETEWNVWFSDPAQTFSVAELHPVPADAAARVTHADVQAFTLGTGYEALAGNRAPASFDDLFSFDGADLDNLLYYLGAWSSESCKADGPCDQN